MLEITQEAYDIAEFFIPSRVFPTEIKVIILKYAGLLRYSRRSVMFVLFNKKKPPKVK